MDDQVRLLPRLDLAKYELEGLALNLVSNQEDEERTNLTSILGSDYFSFESGYSRSRTVHSIYGVLSPDAANSVAGARAFCLFYAGETENKRPRPTDREAEFKFVERLSGLGEVEFLCRAGFVFPSLADESMWFPLPTRFGANSPDSKLEIRGVEGVQIADGEQGINYRFSMNRPNNDSTRLDLYFAATGVFGSELVERVWSRALSISEAFVQRDSRG